MSTLLNCLLLHPTTERQKKLTNVAFEFRHDLSADKVEEVLRIAMHTAIQKCADEPGLPSNMMAAMKDVMMSNIWSMKDINPKAPWLCALTARYQLDRDCGCWADAFAAIQVP